MEDKKKTTAGYTRKPGLTSGHTLPHRDHLFEAKESVC
jgi:hypothetical protein